MEKVKVNSFLYMTKDELKDEIERLKTGVNLLTQSHVMDYQQSVLVSQTVYNEIERLEKLL